MDSKGHFPDSINRDPLNRLDLQFFCVLQFFRIALLELTIDIQVQNLDLFTQNIGEYGRSMRIIFQAGDTSRHIFCCLTPNPVQGRRHISSIIKCDSTIGTSNGEFITSDRITSHTGNWFFHVDQK